MQDYEMKARLAAVRQMPNVPKAVFDALPLDGADEGKPYLWQSGGFTMALACGTRLMTEDEGFIVGDAEDDDLIYYAECEAEAYELAYCEKWGLDANRYTRAIVDSIVREWILNVTQVAPS